MFKDTKDSASDFQLYSLQH